MSSTSTPQKPIHVIGAGLAGSEAAWQIAQAGIPVIVHEMRPTTMTAAHQGGDCAELVCSNSFRSDDPDYNAVGLLHEEMRKCQSLILQMGDKHKVPAGGALAVDRDGFSASVTAALKAHPLITFVDEVVPTLPPADWGQVIIATGPLTAPALSEAIRAHTGEAHLAFYDAIAPIVTLESVNMERAWFQSRYDKGDGKDYLNCPMEKDEYLAFVQALNEGEKTEFKEWETKTSYFEGCLPVEVMAERGVDTLRYGPMKPVGLTDPHTGRRPYAVVQLRQDNALGTLYNLVGFQTKLKYGDQARVFRMIPGLETAEFVRLGGIHRNTFINSPRLLDEQLRLKSLPHIRFAGQITGCEGYVESASVGLMAARFAIAEYKGETVAAPAATTALGALISHITVNANADTFQPMNVNFGLFPPLPETLTAKGKKKDKGGRERKAEMAARAREDIKPWLAQWPECAPCDECSSGAAA
jgi:methylenetetrahydrofolate--tRNA-(uracil-5-)-methyltransferase